MYIRNTFDATNPDKYMTCVYVIDQVIMSSSATAVQHGHYVYISSVDDTIPQESRSIVIGERPILKGQCCKKIRMIHSAPQDISGLNLDCKFCGKFSCAGSNTVVSFFLYGQSHFSLGGFLIIYRPLIFTDKISRMNSIHRYIRIRNNKRANRQFL